MVDNFRDHAANERTFLAWVRTAIAIVGFGLLIGKVATTDASSPQSSGALIGAGLLLIAFAGLRFHYQRRRINAEKIGTPAHWSFELILSAMIAILVLLLLAFAVFSLG
ncbi:MAG: YidH family protein [Parvularcula sp.]